MSLFDTDMDDPQDELWTCEDCGLRFEGPPRHQTMTGVLCDDCGDDCGAPEVPTPPDLADDTPMTRESDDHANAHHPR